LAVFAHLLRLSLRRFRVGFGFGLASAVAALLAVWTIAHFAARQPLLVPLCISGLVIALSIVRSYERQASPGGGTPLPAWAEWTGRFGLIPLVALLGTLITRVTQFNVALGFALIAVPLVLGIWVRRFGPFWVKLGTLWTFPFVAVLVTPAAAVAAGAGVWWGALAAGIAVAWGSILGWFVASPRGHIVFGTRALLVRAAALKPASAAPVSPRKLVASDRMAIHLAVSLAAAILLGWWLLPSHLAWFVLTAFIVNSGNRGRADVVFKGVQRVLGAGVGTVVATFVGAAFAPGDTDAVVVIFIILGLGAVLRPVSYAWWAAAMTGGLAMLYGFLGRAGPDVLGQRLLAILLGGVIAIAASCFIVPVRSIDVIRRRMADLLAVGRDVLTRERGTVEYRALTHHLREAVGGIEQLSPPFHTLRAATLGRIPAARRTADVLDRAAALGAGLEAFVATPSREAGEALGDELRAVREVLIALRRD
jgi:hypothetical protein